MKYLFGTRGLGICSFHTLLRLSLLGSFMLIDPFEFASSISIGSHGEKKIKKYNNCRSKGLTYKSGFGKV